MNERSERDAARAEIEDVLITGAMAARPHRSPDYEAENQALSALTQAMAASQEKVLHKLVDTVRQLCRADSAAVTIVESDGSDVFRWQAAAGALAGRLQGTMPCEASPSGTLLQHDTVLLLDRPDRHFPELRSLEPSLFEALLAPFHADGHPVGMLWAMAHSPERRFDSEDARLLQSLSRFASAAFQMSAALREVTATRDELERRVRERTEELGTSEERFRLLMHTVKDYAIFLMDPAGNVASWNEGAQRILGYSADEVLGRPGALFFTEEDRQKGMPERERRAAVETGRAMDENWQMRKDGSRFWASGVNTALRDKSGRLRGFAKIFRDLTERKAAEDAVREKDLRLRAALTAARMGTWLWDIPANRQILDESLQRLLGLPPGHAVRDLEGFLQVIHPDDRDAVAAAFLCSARDGVGLDVEFRVVWPDGEVHWLKDQGDVLPGPDGRPLYLTGACVDVTERRRMEEELRRARDELEKRVQERTAELVRSQERALQAERLATIGQTVTALAHEGRNALQRAYGCLARLAWKLEGKAEELELTDRTRLALDDLQLLFEDVRSYAAPIRLEFRSCDLGQVWRQAWSEAVAQHPGRSPHLQEDAGELSLECEADPFRLAQVFANLFSNALEACPDPVQVVIACTETVLGGRPALRVSVRDNGPGFPPEQRPYAFEPFHTTKAKGTGLGMAIMKRFVEAHGGTIAIADSAEEGAGLVLTIPRARAVSE